MITAGATRERLDPVRYMTNDSSGKMGFALAEAARERGAEVTVVAGSTTAKEPVGVNIVRIESTRELLAAVTERAEAMDVIIQAAAPADYRFARQYDQKLTKQEGAPLVLELVENPDVAAAVGQLKHPGQTLVGFAAETENLLANARRKLEKKNLDMIVANDVTMKGAGFSTDTNVVKLLFPSGEIRSLELMSKEDVGNHILDIVRDSVGH